MKTIQLVDKVGYLSGLRNPIFFIPSLQSTGEYGAEKQANCRETFGSSYFTNATKMVGYYNGPAFRKETGVGVDGITPECALAFWREVEKRLELKEEEFMIGSLPNTLIINLDPFWTINHTRRGMFTMLFRCACSYAQGKDFEADLEAYTYTQKSNAGIAVRHFLSGHTTPTYEDNTHHIYNRFRLKGINFCRENLIKMIEV